MMEDTTADNVSAEAEILQIINDQVSAWNAGDARALCAHFAEDGSFTNILGSVLYGRRAVEEQHAAIFATFFKGSGLAMTVSKIRFARPDVAIVDVATEVSDPRDMPSPLPVRADGRFRTRLQEVFVKDSGKWWIASFHNVALKEL